MINDHALRGRTCSGSVGKERDMWSCEKSRHSIAPCIESESALNKQRGEGRNSFLAFDGGEA